MTTTYTGLPAKTLSYTYHADGSRAGMTTPVGSFSYLYDGAGRPTSLTNPYSETTAWTYQDNDWLNDQTLANGVTTVHTFNALGQLTDHLNRLGTSTVLSQFNAFLHDGAGNRLNATASIPAASSLSGSLTYTYDTKDQVTSEARTGGSAFSTTFDYDGAGNPTTFKGLTRTYDNQNQLTGGTGLGTFAYDLQGSPTTYNGTAATYDAEGGLLSFGTALTADYTADGLRAWKENGSSVRTYFLYDGLTPVIEMDDTGAAKAVNTFGANGLVSRRAVSTSTSIFYTFDERGNTTQRLDASGNVLTSRVYDSFGVGTGSPADPYDGFGAQHGYYTDTETGLVLCTWRYYDPMLGRWLTRDPIEYEGGVNLYGYALNNPIMRVDSLGLDPPLFDAGEINFGRIGGKDIGFAAAPIAAQAAKVVRVGVGTAVVHGAIILGGVVAGYELVHYKVGHPSGPFTQIGQDLADTLFPMECSSAPKNGPPPNLSPQGAKRRGAFREAKRRSGIPVSQHPSRVLPNVNRQGTMGFLSLFGG